jgi:hypothetical protein
MLPPKTDQKWEKLATGEIDHEFKLLAAGLMMSRLRREIKGNATPATIRKCVDEEYAFFQKYESIMHDDIAALFGEEKKYAV